MGLGDVVQNVKDLLLHFADVLEVNKEWTHPVQTTGMYAGTHEK